LNTLKSKTANEPIVNKLIANTVGNFNSAKTSQKMKNISYFDIIFIILTAGILTIISYLGYAELLSRYALIVALTAYLVGKYIGRIELRRKIEKERSL